MQQDGPKVARPGYVSLLPGGPQDFPTDPMLEAMRQDHRPVNPRRRPAGECGYCVDGRCTLHPACPGR